MIQREIEIVTPAFAAGAVQRPDGSKQLNPEGIRAPAIIAGLRWWFRALAGGILGTTDLARLRQLESGVFGGIGYGRDGAKASRLSMRVWWDKEDIEFTPYVPAACTEWNYLAFAMKAERNRPARCYMPPGTKFQVGIRIAAKRTPADLRIGEELPAALLDLSIRYGGIGARTRRALGGLHAVSEPGPAFASVPQTISRDFARASAAVRKFLKENDAQAAGRATGLPAFPVIHPAFFKLKLRSETVASWRSGLGEIARLLRGSRTYPEDVKAGLRIPTGLANTWNSGLFEDYLKSDLHLAPRPVLRHAGLGLPIPFQCLQVKENGVAAKGIAAPSTGRRASPLWFRLLPIEPNRYAILSMYWRSQFLPAESTGVFLSSANRALSDPLDYDPDEAQTWFDEMLPPPDLQRHRTGWTAVDWSGAAGRQGSNRD